MNNVNNVVNRNRTDQTPFGINHHRRHPAVFTKHMRHFFLIGININRHNLAIHNVIKLVARFGTQEFVQRNLSGRMQMFVRQKDIIKAVRQFISRQQITPRFSNRPAVRHTDKLARHNTPGGIFRIRKRGFDLLFELGRQAADDVLLLVIIHMLQNLDRLVRVQFIDDVNNLILIQTVNDLLLNNLVQFGENVRINVRTKDLNELSALIVIQNFNQLGQVIFRQALDNLPDMNFIIFFQSQNDGIDHLRPQTQNSSCLLDLFKFFSFFQEWFAVFNLLFHHPSLFLTLLENNHG